MSSSPAHNLSLREIEEFDPHASNSGVERRFLCPLCGEAKPRDSAHRSLSMNAQSGAWLCYRCGEKGKLAEWKENKPSDFKVARRRKLRRAFALDELPVSARADNKQIEAENQDFAAVSAYADTAGSTPSWRAALQNLQALQSTPGETYLLSRGIPLELAHAAGVRFSPSWFGRAAVVFPIREAGSTLVAAQGRYVGTGRGLKARTVGEKKAGLFSTANLWKDVSHGAPIVICEAPIDALSLAVCGFPAIALCGKDGWPDWLPIKCAFKDVAIAFDADAAGDAGAEKLAGVLAALGAKPFRLRPDDGKDWNAVLTLSGESVLRDWLAVRLLL